MAKQRRTPTRRKSAKQAEEKNRSPWAQSWLDEALAVLCFACALFLLLSFISEVNFRLVGGGHVVHSPSSNLVGPMGHVIGTLLVGALGWCALVPVLLLLWLSVYLWVFDTNPQFDWFKFGVRTPVGIVGVLVSACALGALAMGEVGGGSVGVAFSEPLQTQFNMTGATLVSTAGLLLFLALGTGLSVLDILAKLWLGFSYFATYLLFIPVLLVRGVLWCLKKGIDGVRVVAGAMYPSLRRVFQRIRKTREEQEEEVLPPPRRRRNRIDEELDAEVSVASPVESTPTTPEQEDPPPTHVVVKRRKQSAVTSAREFVRKLDHTEAPDEDIANAFKDFTLPSLNLLSKGEALAGAEDDEELREKSRQIELKLRDFGIMGRVTHVHPGPVITLFEFEPAPGVKVGRIAALQDDLAMTLRATSIRIIAPIPRRGTVGIEVPNRNRDIVRLRDVLESDAFVSAESLLTVCIGKDTYGEPVVADIAVMPHLLMAGATGTGKSVCINAVLLSLLYRASPAELGLILIDPKILELSVYEDIPHLRVPVVTHPRQAKAVLQWAADEMNRRYRVMQRFGVRNIDGYNRVVSGETEKGERSVPLDEQVVTLTEDAIVQEGIVDRSDDTEEGKDLPVEQLRPLPKIVIVIDELADLMLSVGRDIEELITRLAQKARAAGIHLIVATQRPSVDVITGLIKANFPARLSFRVSSRIDSRTILDCMGADKLLGRGDMLLMFPGAEAIKRVHGAFVSDGEVKRVVSHIKSCCSPRYDERIMQVCEKALKEEEQSGEYGGAGEGNVSDEYDSMYDKAVELVVQKGQASTSMIQRAFRIGYNRAARIIEMMEKDGVIGPMDGVKPREVLVPRPELEAS